MLKQQLIHATAEIWWYKTEKSGKIFPPLNAASFAANARHKGSSETEIFSLIIYFNDDTSSNQKNPQIADLHFFATKIVLLGLAPGSELFITEGPKIIGEAKILMINQPLD